MKIVDAGAIDAHAYDDQARTIARLVEDANLDTADRKQICARATELVRDIRAGGQNGLMEVFLAEYGLSTDEGVALMCLAEALLRVPDAETIDALIEDKIVASNWQRHLGQSTSSLVNASTWALMLTGRVLDDSPPGPIGHLKGAIKRLGEPVIRTAVSQAMKEMGRQFVLGETIESAMKRATELEEDGYTYSYDMLGEAALTDADAKRYHVSYSRAISALAHRCTHQDIRKNPGISVKLSALYPCYERAHETAVFGELVPRLRSLALLAKSAGMGLNIDAEEADRLSLSLQVIEQVISEPSLAGWEGLGIVVQAYSPRASAVIDTIYALATHYDRKLMVRLVKGAYWDTEIKRAQVAGANGFPVFTQKAATDISYIANARRLLNYSDRLYPQFATHNAHSVTAILHMAKPGQAFEFQRLHGMGEALHSLIRSRENTRCRIYAPVGAHKDLLAYLVRRLLENGANSSFVNQIVDHEVSPEVIAKDPFETITDAATDIPTGLDLFSGRQNSRGFDLWHIPTLQGISLNRDRYKAHTWRARTLLAGFGDARNTEIELRNPAKTSELVGQTELASTEQPDQAFGSARIWDDNITERRRILNAAADLYEQNHGELFALLAREAGKTLPDAVAELREAVDFLRYYANDGTCHPPAGTFVCISPWNFPLAIFTGQVAGALAAGNAVIAKPAEQTPLVAYRAVQLLHEAGVPKPALQLVIGDGTTGARLTSDKRVNGVAFTGSNETARKIRQNLARHAAPGTPLIAETGGLNAMVVDSTALPEQAVSSIIESAFQSAGQRCSALRCLYVQEDIADDLIDMLIGAMEILTIGDPWDLATDIGPIIDDEARQSIDEYITQNQHRIIYQGKAPSTGHFVPPTLLKVDGIQDLRREVFGPVLHVATFAADDLNEILDAINATGYGLTFGLHTRIDDRVQAVTERMQAGNIYVNRNQIGAIVGSQPFGGRGLSGTGPKAGGPDYLVRFRATQSQTCRNGWDTESVPELPTFEHQHKLLKESVLPGPTGELNRLEHWRSPPLLCLGPGRETVAAQLRVVRDLNGTAIGVDGPVSVDALRKGQEFAGVIWWGDADMARAIDIALSQRDGRLIPLITAMPDHTHVTHEHHLCVDTTASGGNAALLGAAV